MTLEGLIFSMPPDPVFILLALVLVVFIVFQIRNGRKRRQETETRQSQFVPGAEIMTNYGLYGTIVSIDDDKSLAVIETSPGNEVKIHRQTILKLADYDTVTEEGAEAISDEVATDDAGAGPQLNTDTAIRADDSMDGSPVQAPQYGERTDDGPRSARSGDQ